MSIVIVSGSFDDLRSSHMRFLEEASRSGRLKVLLWDDEAVKANTGHYPKFGLNERCYFVESLRCVSSVVSVSSGKVSPAGFSGEVLAALRADSGNEPGGDARILLVAPAPGLFGGYSGGKPAVSAVEDVASTTAGCTETGYVSAGDVVAGFCACEGLGYSVLDCDDIAGFPETVIESCLDPVADSSAISCSGQGFGDNPQSVRPRVIVTGTFDWLHTGHVRFFEEAAARGELTAVVGHDANIRLLKGEGHPLISEDERRYMVGSIRYVSRALLSTGHGWLDAEPEIVRLKPDEYVVNADGDKPEKRRYCEGHGIRYVVLERKPREGLPARSSTTLRGF